MSSNSEGTREGVKDRLTPPMSQSSTTGSNVLPKSSEPIDLQAPPPLGGTSAKRLQKEDDRQDLFQHLPETYSLSHRLSRHGWSTLRYLTQTEVHTYAFSVAAH